MILICTNNSVYDARALILYYLSLCSSLPTYAYHWYGTYIYIFIPPLSFFLSRLVPPDDFVFRLELPFPIVQNVQLLFVQIRQIRILHVLDFQRHQCQRSRCISPREIRVRSFRPIEISRRSDIVDDIFTTQIYSLFVLASSVSHQLVPSDNHVRNDRQRFHLLLERVSRRDAGLFSTLPLSSSLALGVTHLASEEADERTFPFVSVGAIMAFFSLLSMRDTAKRRNERKRVRKVNVTVY